jgi:CDP-paratose 2-epimerase
VNDIPLTEKEQRYDFRRCKGVNEDQSIDLTGHTPYGVSKLSGDLYVQDYAHTFGLKTGVFRMSCIYGTRQFGFEDQGWIAWFAIAALTGQPVTIFGDGKQVRDVLHVDDLARAYLAAYENREDINGQAFNIGGGQENTVSLLEYLEILQNAMGMKIPCGYSDWRPGDQKIFVSDISKAKALLAWSPHISVNDGVKGLVSWVRENSILFS